MDTDPKVNYVDVSGIKPDSSLTAYIDPYKTKLEAEMNSVIGYLGENMEKGYPDGKLGNFVADILYKVTLEKLKPQGINLNQNNSFCLMNNGGLRVNLQKGEMITGKAFELLPFENTVATVILPGRDILTALSKIILDKKGQPVSQNVFIEYKNGKLSRFMLNGIAIDSNELYVVITNDYMANGGDNMMVFRSAKERKEYPELKLRDCFIEYMKLNSSMENPALSGKSGRIKIE